MFWCKLIKFYFILCSTQRKVKSTNWLINFYELLHQHGECNKMKPFNRRLKWKKVFPKSLSWRDIKRAYAILSQIVSLATIEPCRKSKVLTTFVFYYRVLCVWNYVLKRISCSKNHKNLFACQSLRENFFTLHRSWWSAGLFLSAQSVILFSC